MIISFTLVLLLSILYCSPSLRLDGRGPQINSNVRGLSDDLESANHHEFVPLQVMCEVNGHSIPAIIDTGAQISVMSLSCAKRCNLLKLIDSRYSGRAVGVGSSEIIGRIDDGLSIRIGPVTFQSRVSVLKDSGIDFLIGLDFLRKFQGEVNLRDNILRLQVRNKNIRIPFLKSSALYNSIDYSGHNDISMDSLDSRSQTARAASPSKPFSSLASATVIGRSQAAHAHADTDKASVTHGKELTPAEAIRREVLSKAFGRPYVIGKPQAWVPATKDDDYNVSPQRRMPQHDLHDAEEEEEEGEGEGWAHGEEEASISGSRHDEERAAPPPRGAGQLGVDRGLERDLGREIEIDREVLHEGEYVDDEAISLEGV